MIVIQVRLNDYDEYEVPAPTTDELYFTDDRDDAIGTAKIIHGDDNVHCVFRRGTYQQED